MTALKHLTSTAKQSSTHTPNKANAVTNISVHARVDYTLRFSTPAVYVLGQDKQAYGHVASHYIESAAGSRNVAYVACSSQLNNIQMRCRIIEQLFGEQLFDPEEPLAVSIVNLMKKNPQPLSVVLEHCHYLSLQIIHEVCQLAQIAKKSQLDIQVLLAGSVETGQLISENALLFKDKVSIVNAEDAQLINLHSAALKKPKQLFKLTPAVKFVGIFSVVASILVASVYGLWQFDVVNFSSLPKVDTQSEQSETLVLTKLTVTANEEIVDEVQQEATPTDVLHAISGMTDTALPEKPVMADVADVYQALMVADLQMSKEIANLENAAPNAIIESEATVETIIEDRWPHHQTYKLPENGFVIQYGLFSNNQVKADFVEKFADITHFTYQRVLKGKELSVLTSKIYSTREEAQTALSQLPQGLLERGVWIKSLLPIKDEISAFESSQLSVIKDTI